MCSPIRKPNKLLLAAKPTLLDYNRLPTKYRLCFTPKRKVQMEAKMWRQNVQVAECKAENLAIQLQDAPNSNATKK